MGSARMALGLAACLPIFAGCATTTGGQVQEVETGTYSIGVVGSGYILTQGAEAIKQAVSKAGEYCHAKGQKLQVLPNSASNEVRFRCVASSEVAPVNPPPVPR
jgi:hypothetical protein